MAIIFLNRYFHPDHSATAQMLSDLAFHLARAGQTVTVITSRQQYDNPGANLPSIEAVEGVRIIRVSTPRFGRKRLLGRALDYLGFYIAATARLMRILRKGDIAIAKTDPPLLSIPAAIVCRLRGARLINWLQDLFPEVATALGVRATGGAFGRLLQRWRNWSLRAAWRNVVIGERMREQLLTEGISDAKLVVIHNWADGMAIAPRRAEENPLRHEWGLDGKFVVGYSGNLGRAHEIDTLIGAADKLRDQKDIVFLFVGGGAYLDALKEEASARGLGNLAFQPYQPRDRLALSLSVPDAHVVILRPELEGMIVPSKYYGIAAAGRPTLFIGSPEGEIARILRDAHCGHTVGPGDAEALVNRIMALRDASEREAMGSRARARFEEQYDFPIAFERWRTLLHSD